MKYHIVSSPIRLCFLGCGKITKSHVKHAKKYDKNIQLSFASRTIEKANSYLKQFNGKHAYGSYQKAINSDEIDVVMINTPPHLHFELTQSALMANKHVIVEKPPFFKSSDFDTLGELAEQKGLHLMVAENYYYKPLRRAIAKAIEEKVIGDILFMVINATKYQASKNDWRDNPDLVKHGALFEGGIHWVNFINNLSLEITDIKGFVPKQKDVLEKSIQTVAQTKEGVLINLLYSWEVNTLFKGLRISRIYGTKGSITFETNGVFVLIRGKKKRFTFPDLKNITGSQLMFNDFLNALKTGNLPSFTWQMAKQDLRLIESVYNSL